MPVLTLVGRGRLPYALLYGEPLARHALRALSTLAATDDRVRTPRVVGRAEEISGIADVVAGLEVQIVEAEATYTATGPVLLHDPLCPMVGPDLLGEVLDLGLATGLAVAAHRPVTDTVKTVVGGRIEGTVDRDDLAVLVSPILVPDGVAPLGGFAAAVAGLRARGEVRLHPAPATARRVDDESALRVLEHVLPRRPAAAPPAPGPRGR